MATLSKKVMIDYRSDTVTRPSAAMRRAMAEAEVGDDVLREDPTMLKLENRAADITGKEAALFVPSGTFANQLALFTWVPAGGEVYINETTHIIQYEAGASAHISAAFLRPFTPRETPWAEWSDIAPRLRSVNRDQHYPKASLVCLENALSSGRVQPLASMEKVRQGAQKSGLPIHLDGARLFNAALALKLSADVLAKLADSVCFCLSKGLGAPVGSLLCGSKDFIEEAFYKRKIMGGGMRQVGVLAAAGLVALNEELPRLKEDHLHARALAAAFGEFTTFEVLNPQPEINMVFLRLQEASTARNNRLFSLLREAGILTYAPEDGVFRFVTHRDVTAKQIAHTQKKLPSIVESLEEDN